MKQDEHRITRQPPSFSGPAFLEGAGEVQPQIGDRWIKDPLTKKWVKRNDTDNSEEENEQIPQKYIGKMNLKSFHTSPKSNETDLERATPG